MAPANSVSPKTESSDAASTASRDGGGGMTTGAGAGAGVIGGVRVTAGVQAASASARAIVARGRRSIVITLRKVSRAGELSSRRCFTVAFVVRMLK